MQDILDEPRAANKTDFIIYSLSLPVSMKNNLRWHFTPWVFYSEEMKKGRDGVKQCDPFTSHYDPFHQQHITPHANGQRCA